MATEQKYRIETDKLNWIIAERRVVQDEKSANFGSEYWTPIKYFGSLEHLCQSLCDYMNRERYETGMDVAAMQQMVQQSVEDVRAIVAEYQESANA